MNALLWSQTECGCNLSRRGFHTREVSFLQRCVIYCVSWPMPMLPILFTHKFGYG